MNYPNGESVKPQTSSIKSQSSKRLLSLDVLRGLTVACMIMVNNGAGPHTFSTLQHSRWNGLTPCDLVFPFFLFIMGISTYLSLRKTQFKMSAPILKKIFRRTLIILLIGLAINWFDMACDGRPLDFAHLRYCGVMQRIALCYLAVSLLALTVNHRSVLTIAFLLLLFYTALIMFGGGYVYDSTSNILSKIDLNLLGYNHLYHKSPVDPEGLVSTISAIAHTMIGFYCGMLICKARDNDEKVMRLLLVGALLLIAGWLLQFAFPLNKRIWSPSYVLVTCGAAAMLQGILMYIIDIRDSRKWTVPLIIFGVNPLFLYVMSEFLGILFGATGVKDGAYSAINTVVANPYMASLTYALLFVLLHAVMGLILYKRKIYIKI